STGYGYTVCTIGRAGYDASMIPLSEEFCEIIIYTHVYLDFNGTEVPTTGQFPYTMFTEVARAHKTSKFVRFGISYSPLAVPVQLTANPPFGQQFVDDAVQNWKENGFSVFGTMGLQKKIMDITHDPQLVKWYQVS
ncbi:hypothetical protein MTO96_033175, partial [Rhipicephalus appendiculatus]